MIMLGNLSIADIERRAGVTFPREAVEFMEPRRQQKAENIKEGKWHCFDIPFALVCGDTETAKGIVKHLQPLGKFKESLQVAVQSNG